MLAFQREIDAFERELPGLLADHRKGEFALLKDGKVERILPTYEQALDWGYAEYGLDAAFFVKQVQEVPQATHFRRIR